MSSRIRGFDGLRAIAVIMVFLHHKAPFHTTGIGRFGVWVFFALSGFLITGILTNQRRRIEAGATAFMPELKTFLYRRTLRIFPVYYLLLTALTILVFIGALPSEHKAGLPFYFTYLSNFWIGWKGEWPGSFSHFWSLAVEEQFYLFFAPLLLALPVKRHWQACLVIFAIGIPAMWLFKHGGENGIFIYTHPLSNFWILALGGLGYHVLGDENSPYRRHMMHAAIVPVLLAVMVGLLSTEASWSEFSPTAYTATILTIGLCVAGLVFWVVCNTTSALTNVLETRWLASLGKISYGIYLFHQFVPDLTKSARLKVLFGNAGVPWWATLLAFAVMVALVVVFSKLSWHFIEEPILRLKDHKRAGLPAADIGLAGAETTRAFD